MTSKQDEYLAQLVTQYQRVDAAIIEYETALTTRLLSPFEADKYKKAYEKRKELLQAMGVEFIGVWERLQRLKGK